MLLSFLRSHLVLLPALLAALVVLLALDARVQPALLALLTPFALQLAIAAAAFAQSIKPTREAELEQELVVTRQALSGLFRPKDHVEMSKLERALGRAEKALAQLQGKQPVYKDGKKQPDKPPPTNIVGFLSYGVQPLALLALTVLHWSTPMLLVAPELLWPLGWLYQGKRGVSIVSWLWLCATAASTAVPALAAALGLAPAKEKTFLDSVGLGALQPLVGMVLK